MGDIADPAAKASVGSSTGKSGIVLAELIDEFSGPADTVMGS
jgi:hypothetical protein